MIKTVNNLCKICLNWTKWCCLIKFNRQHHRSSPFISQILSKTVKQPFCQVLSFIIMVSMFCKCYLVYELVSSIKLEHSLLTRTVNKYESFHLNTPLSTARTVASFGGNLAGRRVRYLQPRQFLARRQTTRLSYASYTLTHIASILMYWMVNLQQKMSYYLKHLITGDVSFMEDFPGAFLEVTMARLFCCTVEGLG